MSPMREKGFSLIEVMVGVAILSVMSLLLYSTMNRMLNAKVKVERQDEAGHAVSITINKMAQDLSQAFLAATAFEGTDGNYKSGMKGDESSLYFSTFGHYHYIKDRKDTDQVDVGYFLKKNEKGYYNLIRSESQRLNSKLEKGGTGFVILDNVKELKFEYYDSNKEDWVPEWDTASISSLRRLPQTVKIGLTLVDLDDLDKREKPRERFYFTMVSIDLYKNEINF